VATLDELARVIRSKNASPFLVTLDIFFERREEYDRVKRSGVLAADSIARRYGVPEDWVNGPYYVDQALGIKVTLLRRHATHALDSSDCYGAQQHLPLTSIEVPDG
jgi:Domain of unknown function (DUF4387)